MKGKISDATIELCIATDLPGQTCGSKGQKKPLTLGNLLDILLRAKVRVTAREVHRSHWEINRSIFLSLSWSLVR